jgi:hypothetical protein
LKLLGSDVVKRQHLLQILQSMSDGAGAALEGLSSCGTIVVTLWVMVIHGV